MSLNRDARHPVDVAWPALRDLVECRGESPGVAVAGGCTASTERIDVADPVRGGFRSGQFFTTIAEASGVGI
ncbi:MAG: hypothetical protein R3E64_03955 [Halioglobus sp.]